MNRQVELHNKKTVVAFLGLNEHSYNLANTIAEGVQVMIGNLTSERGANYSAEISGDKENLKWISNNAQLRGAGIYYIDSVSDSINDWGAIKETAVTVGKSLNPGDWIVFGANIDPDLAEVVLLELIQNTSGLKLGLGFEVAFCPGVVNSMKFENLTNEVKLSHNLIIDSVEKVLNTQIGGEFGSNQINFRDPKQELNSIKVKINELWVPMLNEMTPGTFKEFMEMTIHHNFLNAYAHLRMSNELRVDWKRFFRMAYKCGLKHDISALEVLTNIRLVG